MTIKRSISGRIDKGSIGHNNRKFIAPNVNKDRTHENITLVREDIQTVYHELFDKALEEYNAKQKRKDRRIKNYYEHINHSKQEKPFYEVLFQIGNTEDTHCGTREAELATKVLTDFVNGFQERNPHIRVFNAVIHLDEETPHVHIDFVPFATDQKRGLSTRNSLSKALEQQGFTSEGKMNTCTKQWVESEKEQLSEVMKSYGIEWEKLGTHEQHLDVLDYKKKMRAQEVRLLENKVECTQHQLESTEKVLHDADETLARLDTEYVKKSEAVEKLGADIEEKSAELENTTEQLTINQQLLQATTDKVAQINDIDSITIKHTVLGNKVTLSADDYASVAELAKKEIAAEHDTSAKDEKINQLTEQVHNLQAEQIKWRDERSALKRTIDKLQSQVSRLTNELATFKSKYDKVMQFIENLGLKEKLDNFLHPVKSKTKHR
ncbi:plasmid recombination enzyme [Ruminococcus albus 8]|uniref:Plasmid recombination enzyme n=1 Tax=Ruminococcus albus 8 TaxID=246199 RepID=E9S989_RUMAL|nr:plasmid recombination protein [Ruminococcus albus]EGC04154.1 plasmid recombination enzyme [Ruminococcus albus 8]